MEERQENERVYYYENGCKYQVEILHTKKWSLGVQYKLKVLQVIRKGSNLPPVEKGLEFEVAKSRIYAGEVNWKLKRWKQSAEYL